jgi:hypothetical protein
MRWNIGCFNEFTKEKEIIGYKTIPENKENEVKIFKIRG